jgi:hypothetical protein
MITSARRDRRMTLDLHCEESAPDVADLLEACWAR